MGGTIAVSTDFAYVGTNSAKATYTANTSTSNGGPRFQFVASPGRYKVTMWVRIPTGVVGHGLSLQGVTRTVAEQSAFSSGTTKDQWVALRATYDVTSTGTATLYALNTGGAVTSGQFIYVGALLVEKVLTTDPIVYGEYFDGSSDSSSWTGTPHQSTSVRGVSAWHAAMVKGANRALLVGNSAKINYTVPIMKRGREDQPFTIEVTVRVIKKESSNAQIQVFGTASAMDGLVIAGTVVSFTTKYTNTGEARCEFDMQEYQTMRIHAVHTKNRNSLWINGDLVDDVLITDEQQADTYLSAGTSLSAGTTTSANLIAMNGLAIYPRALDEGDIDQHVEEAADNMDEFTVGAAYKGMTFALNSSTSIPILEYVYTDDWQWNMGRASGTVIDDGQVVPQTAGTTSLPGLWETIVPLPPETTLSSITLNWLGEGETVWTSLDGENWNKERRASRISTVNDGFDTTGKALFLRVTFDGNKVNDKSYFDNLVISMYGPVNTVAPQLETRTLTLTNASIEADFDITDYHENWGIELNNGTFSLSGSSPTAIVPLTVQVWAKKGTGSFSDNMQALSTNWYTNDGSYQQDYQTDEWQLRTYTFGSGLTAPLTFTGTGQIGCILIYPNLLTKAQISETYTSFTGTKTIAFESSGTASIIDLSNNVEIYGYDWSIESGG